MKIKNIFGFHVWIFSAVWILLFFAGQSKMFRDPGSFSHAAIGGYILDTKHFIHQDIFSFTKFGEPWIAQQWLGECFMAAIQRLAGFDGLLIVTVSLIALLYSYLALRMERAGINLALGSLILMFSLAAGSHHLHVRPHIATMFFMTVVYALLCDVEAKRKDIRSLLWLIPFFIIWSNIHGGALGGLCTVLFAAAGWTLDGLMKRTMPFDRGKSLLFLWGIVLLCFTAPLINPYGLELPDTWLNIMGSGAISQLIQEHASVFTLIQQGEPSAYATIFMILGMGLFYFSLLAGVERKDHRMTWYIPIIWFFLALSRIRHAPLFAVTAVVGIAEMFSCCRWVRKLAENGLVTFRVREMTREMREPFLVRYLMPAVITGVALLAFHSSAQLPSTSQKWVKLDHAHWPVELLPELKAIEKSQPPETKIFNDMLFGGFLIYHTPGLRVFMDDRCELYGDTLIMQYVRADQNDFEQWEKIYQFEFALLAPSSGYLKYLEKNNHWHVVKRTRAAILYQKINKVL